MITPYGMPVFSLGHGGWCQGVVLKCQALDLVWMLEAVGVNENPERGFSSHLALH